MTKSPVINAAAASLYIAAVGTFMFYGSQFFPKEDNVLMPIAMISLFTLSAAVMGYVFLSQPVMLFLDDKKKQAVELFAKTVGVFALITAVIFGLTLLGVMR